MCSFRPTSPGAPPSPGLGFGKLPESRPRVIARLDLEVSVGWAGPSSHGLCGGNALLLSTGVAVAGNRALWRAGAIRLEETLCLDAPNDRTVLPTMHLCACGACAQPFCWRLRTLSTIADCTSDLWCGGAGPARRRHRRRPWRRGLGWWARGWSGWRATWAPPAWWWEAHPPRGSTRGRASSCARTARRSSGSKAPCRSLSVSLGLLLCRGLAQRHEVRGFALNNLPASTPLNLCGCTCRTRGQGPYNLPALASLSLCYCSKA
jgi:hypothetical protein